MTETQARRNRSRRNLYISMTAAILLWMGAMAAAQLSYHAGNAAAVVCALLAAAAFFAVACTTAKAIEPYENDRSTTAP